MEVILHSRSYVGACGSSSGAPCRADQYKWRSQKNAGCIVRSGPPGSTRIIRFEGDIRGADFLADKYAEGEAGKGPILTHHPVSRTCCSKPIYIMV